MLDSRKKAPENDGNYRFWFCGFTTSNPDKAVQRLLSFADQSSDLRLLCPSGHSKNDEEWSKISTDRHLLSSWSEGCTDFKKCLSVFVRTKKEKPRSLTRRGITDGNFKQQLETSVIKLHKMYPFQHFDDPAKHMEVYRKLITYPRLRKMERSVSGWIKCSCHGKDACSLRLLWFFFNSWVVPNHVALAKCANNFY